MNDDDRLLVLCDFFFEVCKKNETFFFKQKAVIKMMLGRLKF